MNDISRLEEYTRKLRLRLQALEAGGIEKAPRIVATRLLNLPLRVITKYPRLLEGRRCLEIGGPSPRLQHLLPIYRECLSCDNVQYALRALGPGATAGSEYRVGTRALGKQFVCEAATLDGIPENSYDLLVSSHVLEHIANPIQALLSWKRVQRAQGRLVLILPHKQLGFDHLRAPTPFDHIMLDFTRRTGEADMTHLPEILKLHDLRMDARGGQRSRWEGENRENYVTRVIHHHAFVTATVLRMVDFAGFRILSVETHPSLGIVVLGEKRSSEDGAVEQPGLEMLLSSNAEWRSSGFASEDRIATI